MGLLLINLSDRNINIHRCEGCFALFRLKFVKSFIVRINKSYNCFSNSQLNLVFY